MTHLFILLYHICTFPASHVHLRIAPHMSFLILGVRSSLEPSFFRLAGPFSFSARQPHRNIKFARRFIQQSSGGRKWRWEWNGSEWDSSAARSHRERRQGSISIDAVRSGGRAGGVFLRERRLAEHHVRSALQAGRGDDFMIDVFDRCVSLGDLGGGGGYWLHGSDAPACTEMCRLASRTDQITTHTH